MNTLFGLFNLGGGEIILILALILILFGAKKLPVLAMGLGQGIKEFKKATRDVNDEVSRAMEENPPPAPSQKQLSTSTSESSGAGNPQTVSQSSPGAKA